MLILGAVFTSISLFMKDMFNISAWPDGFLMGSGVGLIFGAMIIHLKNKKHIEA